jgi:polyphosphate kinase 2
MGPVRRARQNHAVRRKDYEAELRKLQTELVKLQYWLKSEGERIVLLFEGRDASGKGGMIKAITERLNPRTARITALPAPTEREQSQWYFQRYVAELPAAGELVIFDRSWYNRAGVERVMGFCTEDDVAEFFRSVPEFERMLQRAGIRLVKYWLSVSDDEQDRRFKDRIEDPTRRWKLSPIDIESRTRYEQYSRAKDDMFEHTDIADSPWYVVEADDKRVARLNGIHHFLSLVPYADVLPPKVGLPHRKEERTYKRSMYARGHPVPRVYG